MVKKLLITCILSLLLVSVSAMAGNVATILSATEVNGTWTVTVQGTEWQTMKVYAFPGMEGTVRAIQGKTEQGNTVFVVEPKDEYDRCFNFVNGSKWSSVGPFLASKTPDNVGVATTANEGSCYFLRKPGEDKTLNI